MEKTKTTSPVTDSEKPTADTLRYQYSFTDLFNSYRGELYHTALKITKSKLIAEDVVHDVFVKVWMKRAELHAVGQLRAYLHTMVRNRVLDKMKKNKCEHLIIKRLCYHYSSFDVLHDRFTTKQYNQLLHKAIKQMPAKQQQVYRFVKELGLSHKATAATMQISDLTVKKHIANAMKTIQNLLKRNGMLFQ